MRQLGCGTILAATLLVAACNSDNSDARGSTAFTVRGVSYKIPNEEIIVAALKPAKMAIIRVAPKGAKFDLVLDALKPYLPNEQGPDVPTISDLNSNTFGQFEVIRTKDAIVVCSVSSQPHFNCGLEVDDRGVKWGVLFDRKYMRISGSIRQQAMNTISSYRAN